MNRNLSDERKWQQKLLHRKKRSKQSKEFQKKRSKQLAAFGMLIENAYKFSTVDERQMMVDAAYELLTGKKLGLALDGFARLNQAMHQKRQKQEK